MPNAIAVFRGRMVHEARPKWKEKFSGVPFTFPFRPPRGPRVPAASTFSMGEPAPNILDGAYESVCRLADLLQSRLPEHWRELYFKELSEGGTAHSVLRSEIRRITRDLGIEILDANPNFTSSQIGPSIRPTLLYDDSLDGLLECPVLYIVK